jgi:hypothetical protein
MPSRLSRAVASLLFCAAALLMPSFLLETGLSQAAPSCPPSLGDPRAVTRAEGAACGVALSPAAFSGVTLIADMNQDGIVDIRDYGVWRQNFGLVGCGNPADVTGDCLVDIRDYGVWRQNFGRLCPTVPLLATQGGSTATSSLLQLDPASGAVLSTIGPIGFAVTALAQNPLSGVLYGATTPNSAASPGSLITVNPGTGAGALVGNLGLPVVSGTAETMADLTFDNAGHLYGWSSRTGNLYTVSLTTGASTQVSSTGLGNPVGGGLAYVQGVLFLTPNGDNGNLRQISPATGAQITAQALTGGAGGRNISALTLDRATGLLIGSRIDTTTTQRAADLIAIDPVTAAISVRGPSVNRLDAVAYLCSS